MIKKLNAHFVFIYIDGCGSSDGIYQKYMQA